jgi:hypothetical protein
MYEKVDAIQKRPGKFLSVLDDLMGPAPARPKRIAKITARARVHGPHEHERGREGHAYPGPNDRDPPLLKGLTEGLQDLAVKFGKLVEKKDAVMGEADLAGHRDTVAAAHHAHIGDRVMGSAKRPPAQKGLLWGKKAGHGMDAAYL